MSRNGLRSLSRRIQTRVGQRMNRTVGRLVAQPISGPAAPRISRRVHALLTRVGYPKQNYKVCLLTEAQCLRAQAAYGPPGPLWAGVHMPAVRLLAYQLRQHMLRPLGTVRHVWQTIRKPTKPNHSSQAAGLFLGMNYKFRKADDPSPPEENRYAEITQEATQLLKTYQVLSPGCSGKGAIGILISCYRPEPFIKDFLNNLCSLATPERLIPVVINAGMSSPCRELIEQRLSCGNFKDFHLLDRTDASIYEAWNDGIQALGDNVEFLTNFNVDDRRHPLCLNVQADCLNSFPGKKVAVTDYCFFFKSLPSIKELYARNSLNCTLIPTINERTLIDHNFPHSSPLWRRSLHDIQDCGLFETTYQSAGDAEFWYRVSRRHPEGFQVISIPLSLYFQNPHGLSTRPQTVGASEHQQCTYIHYDHIMNLIDKAIGPAFSTAHLQPAPLEHIQLRAYISALRTTPAGQAEYRQL